MSEGHIEESSLYKGCFYSLAFHASCTRWISCSEITFGGHSSFDQQGTHTQFFFCFVFHFLCFSCPQATITGLSNIWRNASEPLICLLCSLEDIDPMSKSVVPEQSPVLTTFSPITTTVSSLSVWSEPSAPNGQVIIKESMSWNENPWLCNSRTITQVRVVSQPLSALKGYFVFENWDHDKRPTERKEDGGTRREEPVDATQIHWVLNVTTASPRPPPGWAVHLPNSINRAGTSWKLVGRRRSERACASLSCRASNLFTGHRSWPAPGCSRFAP